MLHPNDPRWLAVCALAKKKGATEVAIAKWKQRGAIPDGWHAPLLADPRAKNIPLEAKDFLPKHPTGRGAGGNGAGKAA